MKWVDLFNFLYERANDINNLESFPWQKQVEIFDFATLDYYPADFVETPDNKISLSIDTTQAEIASGS